MSVAGIILAAGGASRMGRAKQLLPYRGGTLVSHAAATMLGSRCRPVIVVVGCGAEAVRQSLAGIDVTCIDHPRWADGIGSSIAAGISYVQEHLPDVRGALLMTCDQPRLAAAALDALVERHAAEDHPLAVACGYGDGEVGVPALFDRAVFEQLRRIDPAHGAKAMLLKHRAAVVNCPQAACDVDTPDDYHQL